VFVISWHTHNLFSFMWQQTEEISAQFIGREERNYFLSVMYTEKDVLN